MENHLEGIWTPNIGKNRIFEKVDFFFGGPSGLIFPPKWVCHQDWTISQNFFSPKFRPRQQIFFLENDRDIRPHALQDIFLDVREHFGWVWAKSRFSDFWCFEFFRLDSTFGGSDSTPAGLAGRIFENKYTFQKKKAFFFCRKIGKNY